MAKDYFKVSTFEDSKDIITMCPVFIGNNIEYEDLNFLRPNKTNEEEKVKRISRIDKFNQKYGIK